MVCVLILYCSWMCNFVFQLKTFLRNRIFLSFLKNWTSVRHRCDECGFANTARTNWDRVLMTGNKAECVKQSRKVGCLPGMDCEMPSCFRQVCEQLHQSFTPVGNCRLLILLYHPFVTFQLWQSLLLCLVLITALKQLLTKSYFCHLTDSAGE